METIRQTQIKYCSRAIVISAATGLIFLLTELRDICRGLMLGTFFSIINFTLIGSTLSFKYKTLNIRLLPHALEFIETRHAILAIPLIISVMYDQYSIGAVILGLFSIELVLITDHISNYYFSTRNTRI